ncbi:hypothetical protein BOTBODRAFT_37509, partial [Botryobasidium botryosum FD-172 SS1]
MSDSAASYISAALSAAPPELRPIVQDLQRLYDRKLWHQLTLALFKFLDHPLSQPYRVDLFNQFVKHFEDKINPLRLAEMCVATSKSIEEPDKLLVFLTTVLARIPASKAPEANVLLLSSIAHAKLLFGDMDGTKVDLGVAGRLLDDLSDVESSVRAAYYSVAADYFKAKADYVPYYKHSLLYLACVNVETDLTGEEKIARAHDLSISALLGDTLYNFGELLMHPILASLDGSAHEWIKSLLFTFNEGNIGKFEALSPQFPREPILQENYPFLRQKICLMALIEAAFKRGINGRTMSFQTIAEETKLPHDEVEHLVMKALSLHLIRGTLDQVSSTAHISWVQPRVLSRQQIGELAVRLGGWCEKLQKTENFVKDNQPELFAGL